MFKLAVVVLALAALGIDARPRGDGAEFECIGQLDGYYPDVLDRAAFYSCYEGNLVAKVVCEEGFEFDGQESCVQVQDNVEAEEVPEQEVTAYLPDASDLDLTEDQVNEDEIAEYGVFRNETSSPKLVLNVEITKNIFPKSIVIIGKANREQKNK